MPFIAFPLRLCFDLREFQLSARICHGRPQTPDDGHHDRQIPRHRHRPADRIYFSSRGHAGIRVNLKGYGEFANDNRPDGWNVWLTFVLSPAPPSSASSPPPMLTKTPRS